MVAKNAFEIFKILNKSNCRECGEKSCLAFAGSVFKETKKIDACPYVESQWVEHFSEKEGSRGFVAYQSFNELVTHFKQKVSSLDYIDTAARIRTKPNPDLLTIPILGKPFGIAKDGQLKTDLHVIPWLLMPLWEYIEKCKGVALSSEWITFREILGGQEKYPLFKRRAEDELKSLADKNTDFFADIVQMFDGKQVDKEFQSDISVVLHPFPLAPVMISYWKPDDGMGSKLNMFFDKSIDVNLGLDGAFNFGTGLAEMLVKISQHHTSS